MRFVAGSDSCTYFQYKGAFETLSNCLELNSNGLNSALERFGKLQNPTDSDKYVKGSTYSHPYFVCMQ